MGCEKYKISETEQSIEEKSILDKGVNLQELLKMPGLEIAGKDNYSQTGKPPITEISMEELAPHLDLSETYLLEDEEETILMAPVRTPGSYARNLVSIRSKGVNLDFTMTYPDPSNRNLFYVTDLKERYVLKIEVDAKGNGNTTIIHIPEIESESFIPCEEMVYVSCSSGEHSFSSPHDVWECIYWNDPSGTPPYRFKVIGPCGSNPGGSGGGGGGLPGGVTLLNDPSPSEGGGSNGNEGAEIPAGGTEAPPFVHIDCIENLDFEDCNIPGDINNDCMMEPPETFLNNLDDPDRAWYLNPDNSAQAQNIQDFLEDNYYSVESVTLAEQIIKIFISHPNITWKHIENWFLNKQTELGPNLNINPDLITYDAPLQQEPLPSLADFVNNFPKEGTPGNYYKMLSSDVYQLVGGTLWTSHINDVYGNYQNACAIRGSRGLLYSGIHIPILHYNGSQRTQKGGDDKNYILDAVSFDKFMRDKFGAPTYELTEAAANDPIQVAAMLNDKNGIYVIINSNPSQADYSGHVDAIIDGQCIDNAYTSPLGGVKSIRIWELD